MHHLVVIDMGPDTRTDKAAALAGAVRGGQGPAAPSIVFSKGPEPSAPSRGPASTAGPTAESRERLCVAFVDVVGFSALMNTDEEGTFRRWRGLREEVVLPLLGEFGGRLVNTTGDGILATFDAAVDGVRWSRELQSAARQRRQGLALRVSLNHCAVLRDGDDLLGNGVNVAARLQEHAPSGGVVLTQNVMDEIGRRPDFEVRPLDRLALRNIGAPVMAFELLTDGRHLCAPVSGQDETPSIAVMPFVNLGGQDEDDYLAAGIVEDIILSLSGQGGLTVISRSSTLAFARQAIDPGAIGSVLGVRYIITGTLNRSGDRISLTAELLDAEAGLSIAGLQRETGSHDIFRVQDELVELALTHLLPDLPPKDRRPARVQRPASLTAYDEYLRALDLIGSLERAPFEAARNHLNRAIDADRRFSLPLAWAARWYSLKIGQGWSDDPRADVSRAADLASRAIRLDDDNALAQATYGHVQSYLFGDFERAMEHLDRACLLNPNSSTAWLLSSVTLSSLGRTDAAVRAAERSLRLSPFDQWLFIHYVFLGIVHYDAGNFGQALAWLSRGLAENPRYTSALRTLAAAHVALGNITEARDVVARLLQLEPKFNMADYQQSHRLYRDPDRAERFRTALLKAGAPEY